MVEKLPLDIAKRRGHTKLVGLLQAKLRQASADSR